MMLLVLEKWERLIVSIYEEKHEVQSLDVISLNFSCVFAGVY